MGTFFNNIHIRKNDGFRIEDLKEYFIEKMTAKGYKQESTEEDAGECNVVIYSPADSEWVSVASDDFLFNTEENIKSQVFPLSELFCTDVIAAECDDSDYLFLNLINVTAGIDGWVNIGKRYGIKNLRRSNIAAWKQSVADYDRFKQIMKQEYVFAEEAFYESAELLKMRTDQMGLETDYLEGLERDQVECLTFYAAASEKRPPKLVIPQYSLVPCRMNERGVVSVVNRGGKSRGIAVLFMGDYVEKKEITFEEVTIEYGRSAERLKVFPIALSVAAFEDGSKAYYWEDKDFPIPPAVNQELPIVKRMELEFEREIAVRFVPKGDERKALDIKVVLVPLQNWAEGQTAWYVYKYSGSKKAYVEEHGSFLRNTGKFDPDEYEV